MDPTREHSEGGGNCILRFLGDYVILGEIARGGMGVVYHAIQVTLQRESAIKVIDPSRFAEESVRRRFRTEAEAMAHLDHPNIVAIHEVGEHQGQPYLSMQFVEGPNLAEYMAGRLLASREAAQIMMMVASAVQYAHDRGVLHRDLKPSNILLDADGIPHVSDFGIAKLIDRGDDWTGSSDTLGTPEYMAPEQALGRARDVTTAADTYSLGAIFYHLLTGRPPFRGSSAMETLALVQRGDPPAPRSLQPMVDRDLEILCMRCLEMEPKRRPGSPHDLVRQLKRWLNHEPIEWRRIPFWERASKWVRRHPLPAAFASTIAFGLFLGGLAWWQAEQAHRTELRRVLQAAESQFAVHESVAAIGTLTRTLRQYPDNAVAMERLVNALRRRVFLFPCAEGEIEETPVRQNDGGAGASTRHPSVRPIDVLQRPFLSCQYLHEHGIGVTSGIPNPSGNRELFVTDITGFDVRDAAGGKLLSVPAAHEKVIRCVRWSPDGRQITTASADRTVKLWDAGDGRLVGRPFDYLSAVNHAELSPNGSLLAAALVDGTAMIRRVGDGSVVGEVIRQPMGLNTVRFSPDGRFVVTASDDGTMRLWHVHSGLPASEPFRGQAVAADAWFGSNSRQLFVRWSSGAVRGYRATANLDPDLSRSTDPTSKPQPATWELFGAARDQESNPISAPGERVLAASPDGRILAVVGDKNRLSIRRVGIFSSAPDQRELLHTEPPNCAQFSPDLRRIATGTSGRRVRVWDVQTGQALTDWMTCSNPVWSLHFAPNGRRLWVSGSEPLDLHVAEGAAPTWFLDFADFIAGSGVARTLIPNPESAKNDGGVDRILAFAPSENPLAQWSRRLIDDETQPAHR